MTTSADFLTQALAFRAVQSLNLWLANADGRFQRARMPNFHLTRRMMRGISWFVACGIIVSFVASLQYRGVFKAATEWIQDTAEYLAVAADPHPEPKFRQRILGLSPGNQKERQLIRLEEGLRLLNKETASQQTKPVPVAVIDASPPGPFAPGILPMNTHMELARHGIEVADVVTQIAGDHVDLWTISAGVDTGHSVDFPDLGRAIRFATAQGVKVIVLSLSPLYYGMDEIKEALDAGVVVVEGTGNNDGQTLASFDSRTIRVSGVKSNGERARHANVGVLPDGFQIATIFAPYYLYFQGREGPYPVLAGTSFATPVVGAAAALVIQADPSGTITNADVKSIIEHTAIPMGSGHWPVLNVEGAIRRTLQIFPTHSAIPSQPSPLVPQRSLIFRSAA